MNQPLMHIRSLCKNFSPKGHDPNEGELVVKALDHIDLKIECGEYIAIIGPSGSGKSTLMQILGLLDRPTSGSMHFLGRDILQLNDDELSELRSHQIGFIFQSFNLLAKSSACENVELPMIYGGVADRKSRATDLLKQVGLGERIDHQPHELSGGQQQRVAVARALANRPPVIFADEPTGNLNQESAKEIMDILLELNQQGVTVILVTHDPNIAAKAHRVITMVDGNIKSDVTQAKTAATASISDALALAKPKVLEFNLLLENFKMAMKSLTANKLRTMLSTLGITIGVASVITMVALGEGAQKSIQEDLKRLGSNLLTVRPGDNKVRVRGSKRADSLTLADAIALKELRDVGVPIERVSPAVDGSAQVSFGNINLATRIQGVSEAFVDVYASAPVLGRFFTEAENRDRKRVCLLGHTVYESLFPNKENPIGEIVKINRINFQVIGLLPKKGGSGFGDRDDTILIPLQTAMYRVMGKDRLDQIAVQVANYEGVPLALSQMEDTLRRRHNITAGKDDDFNIRNMADIQETLSSTTRTMTMLLGIIASISLIVGGIGIMNIMLVSVKERTREIGLRKALGAKNRHVLVQFLIEAVVIGVFGGCAGALVGVITSLALSTLLGWAVLLSPFAILVALSFSTGIGVIFGYWPAKQAASLSPIEALRYQ